MSKDMIIIVHGILCLIGIFIPGLSEFNKRFIPTTFIASVFYGMYKGWL